MILRLTPLLGIVIVLAVSGCVAEIPEEGTIQKENSERCNLDMACISGHCVHNYCRASVTYCGDNACDTNETFNECPDDCDPFHSEFGYSQSQGDVVDLGNNEFAVYGRNTEFSPIPSIVIPINIAVPVENMTYDYTCFGPFFYESNSSGRAEELNGRELYLTSYFSPDESKLYLPTGNKGYTNYYSFVSVGSVNLNFFLDYIGYNGTIECSFTIVSGDPVHNETIDIILKHNTI